MPTEKPRRIDYEKLAVDLEEAKEAALKVRNVKGDGGASNLDYVTLWLPKGLEAKVKVAGKSAGVSVERRGAGAFYVWPPNPDRAQGYQNTARAQAMEKVLKARGWNALLTYVTD